MGSITSQLSESGRTPVISAQVSVDTDQDPLVLTQKQLGALQITATSGNVTFKIRTGTVDGGFTGDFENISVPFNTSIAQTASDVKDALDLLYPAFNITLNSPYVIIESDVARTIFQVKNTFGCEFLRNREGYDVDYSPGDIMVLGSVAIDNIRYSTNSYPTVIPTATNGILVTAGGYFVLHGKVSAKSFRVTEVSGAPTITYEVYKL